jgi:serine/threonine protein kinase
VPVIPAYTNVFFPIMALDPTPDRDESTATRPSMALPDGVRLRDEYQVGEVLGIGSFGITYWARDEHLNTVVAIKEYYPHHLVERSEGQRTLRIQEGEDPDEFAFGLEQFRQEGRTLARFNHPNVVDVRSYFEQHGTGYLVMDYYEGQTLAEYIAEHGGTLPEKTALALMQDVLRGLRSVHAEGVLHRDITPGNIYRTSAGRGVLIDFGAAREAMRIRGQRSKVVLTPGYAPIEQYRANGRHGPQTDIYACASTLYKCLTGLKPPESTERAEYDQLVPPRQVRSEISVETSVAVMKGLSMEPSERPASVEAFAALLARDDGPTQATSDEGNGQVLDDWTGATSTKDVPFGGGMGQDFAVAAGGAPDDSSMSIIGVVAGLLALLGGTLLVSQARAVEVLSFFGTWTAVCFGLVALFREGEKLMSGESRAQVSDWLLREHFADRPANWPSTFVNLFDAVFTENHLSWTCFRRSALTSMLVITVLFAGFVGVGLLSLPTSLLGLAEITALLGVPIAMNVVIDYVSLFETRWVLGRMSASDRISVHVLYLGADLVLTALCIILPVSILQIFGLGLMTEFSLWTSAFWYQLYSAFLNMTELFVTFTGDHLGEIPRVMSVMLFSTLFTSVWGWLYAGAGLILRITYPVLKSLDWLKGHLNVETHPVHAMGMLLVFLTSLGFAVSAPFVL